MIIVIQKGLRPNPLEPPWLRAWSSSSFIIRCFESVLAIHIVNFDGEWGLVDCCCERIRQVVMAANRTRVHEKKNNNGEPNCMI